MDSKAWLTRAMALALVAPALSACSKEDNDEANIEVQTEAAPPAAPVTVTINPMGGAAMTGELTAMHEADDTKVRLNLNGLVEDKTYDAKIRYGDCSIAMNYVDEAAPGATRNAPGTTPSTTPGAAPGTETAENHEIGDEVADFSLNETGTTATGEVDIDNDDLRADEPAFVMVTEDAGVGKPDVLIGCADLSGHTGMGGMGTTPTPAPGATPGTEPGAAAPADSGKR